MMKKNITYSLFAVVIACLMVACADEDMLSDGKTTAYVAENSNPGELLIKFAAGMETCLDSIARKGGQDVTSRAALPSADSIYAILGNYRLQRVFPVDEANEEKTRAAGMHLWYDVTFSKDIELSKAISELSRLGQVQSIQANRVIHIDVNRQKPVVVGNNVSAAKSRRSAQSNVAAAEWPFTDPLLFRQWGYINRGGQSFASETAPSIAGCDLSCEDAWQMCTGDPSIIVAVLDEGVMYAHPDLVDNMWVNEGEELHAEKDADGNGYKDDKYGYNFVTDCGIINPYSADNTGHGTHVAGTIAAVNNNGIGCCGIAGGDGSGNGVKIMSCQIIDGNNSCTLLNEAKAMKYAADNGAVIMQCSWGYNSALADQLMGYTPGPATEEEWADLYPLEKEAIDYFIDTAGSANGVIDGGIAVFAAGNEAAAQPAFPAAYSRCLCVGSIAADFTPSTFTDYGSELDFSAPGGDSDYYGTPGVDDDSYDITDPNDERAMILSTLVVDEQPTYGYYEGTSMACPAVSGVAALGLSYAKQQHRHYTAEQFVKLMKETSRDLDQYYTGTKLYHYYHTMPGTTARVMNLADWQGKMGTLPDAGALLRAVATGGSDMKVPNVVVVKDKDVTVNLADYYTNGASLTYSVTVDDASVATAVISGTKLTVRGITPGMTTATITAGGKQVTITITVRTKTGGYGWL